MIEGDGISKRIVINAGNARERSVVKRLLYATLGLVATGTGILGIFVPGLPTTVFIIVALWAFSRSSPRLHMWLTKLPILRTTLLEIETYQKQKDIPLRAKIISQTAAWLSCIVCTIAFWSAPLSIILFAAAVACSVFMYITPTRQTEVSRVADS